MNVMKLGDIASSALSPGVEQVRITSIEAGVSQNNNPKLVFKAEVASGDHKGKGLLWSYTLTENAIWRLGNDLLNAGYNSERELPFNDAKELAGILEQEMRGGLYTVEVSVSEYQGRKRNDVAFVASAGASGDDAASTYANV